MSENPVPAKAPASSPAPAPLQKYLDKALTVLQQWGVLPQKDTPAELVKLREALPSLIRAA